MRGLFFKIFAIFWIAQSLIFVISTVLIVRHHFQSPDAVFETFDNMMQNDGDRAVAAFESGGCAAVQAYGNGILQTVALKTSSGEVLCNPSAISTADPTEITPRRMNGYQIGQQFVWWVPVTSMSGKKYVFLVSRPHVPRTQDWTDDLRRFSFPQLPVAIVVGGLTTFVMVLIFTRPVVRLRKAASELAKGKLNARVEWPKSQSRIFAGDELQGLMLDFNHMAERLESLVGAQKMLLRDVSHELRSPLARLSVALELAREDEDPKTTAHLDRIEREAERLNLLIGQLLSLSSMEALERVDNFKPFSLNHLIERMIPDAEYEAQQRQCSLAFRSEGECAIAGNEELLYRAVENVVRNAIRFTEVGSEVEIRLAEGTANGARQAEIEISDRGPGIPDDQLGAIFRPFHRVDSARSPDTGGFGVGLAIADRAVRLHHGEISAANRKGGGTTIRITLPAIERVG